MAYIELKDLVKRYGSNLAVDNVSLGIEKGELVGLLGPNGAGKSTTIKMIVGLLSPNSGTISIDGLDISRHSVETKGKLGLVPQEIAVYDKLSARENVEFFGSLYGLRGRELRSKAEDALEFVGLQDKAKHAPKTFSGGMKRRLNIACALVHQPPIMIMDEPTVGIDPQSRNHILQSVQELNRRGTTIIYTSHYMEEVELLCERVAIIDHGRVMSIGTKAELEEQISSEEKVIVSVSECHDLLLEAIQVVPGVIQARFDGESLSIETKKAQESLQDILFVLAKNDVKVHNITVKEPNLESLFLELTGRSLRD